MEVARISARTHKQRTARAEAAAWIVRLHGPYRAPDLEAGFRAWLAADPENERQFERVTETWDAGATPVAGMARVARWREQRPVHARLRFAAVATIIVGAAAWGLNSYWLNPAYSTGVGEQRMVRLPDGTRITLNSASRMTVTYRSARRQVRIDRGEAFFEVVGDAARPFQVRAGDHAVTALGTSFAVRYEPQRLAVTLVEGSVAVSSLLAMVGTEGAAPVFPGLAPGSVTLAPGERLILGTSGPPAIDAPPIDAVTAWRRGEVVLDKTPLAEAVAEMNRYDQDRLVIDDPRVATLQISGIYHTGDSRMFAAMLARLYDLQIGYEDGRIHLGDARGSATAPAR